MVADEDDQRVVGMAFQGFEQQADAGVESLDLVVVAGNAFALFGRIDPLKRQDGLFAWFDERLGDAFDAIENRPVAELFRLRVAWAIGVRVGVVDHQEKGLVAGQGDKLGGAYDNKLQVAGFDVIRLAVIKLERIAGGDMELADDPGSIAGAFEDVGNGGVSQVKVQGKVAAGGEPVLTGCADVESGEHGATRGIAGGLCDVGDVELDSACGEGVDLGSFDNGVAVATELEAEVVGGDKQDGSTPFGHPLMPTWHG